MEYIAESKHIKISPRKVRLVVEGVKKLELAKALVNLQGLNMRAADPVRKTIESAVANAVHNFQADKNGLKIKEIMVNEGIMYKRYHFAARGRVRPYKKRTSHIRVVLEDNLVREQAQAAVKAAAQTETKAAEAQKDEKKTETKKTGGLRNLVKRRTEKGGGK